MQAARSPPPPPAGVAWGGIQAQRNLQAQLASNTRGKPGQAVFAACHATATTTWATLLGRVAINTNTTAAPTPAGSADAAWDDELTKFYTALYHSLMAPTQFSEVCRCFGVPLSDVVPVSAMGDWMPLCAERWAVHRYGQRDPQRLERLGRGGWAAVLQ